ncbi:GTP cyclohydrolase II [Paracoccaceae bacterium GXU_MW_L88]
MSKRGRLFQNVRPYHVNSKALKPSQTEWAARAAADLRLGLPVALEGAGLMLAAETATAERLAALRALGAAQMVISARRAETLRIAAYDGDLARLALPDHADLAWVRAMADPQWDLDYPMKGPFSSLRGGDPAAARAALQLCKDAQLLPAALLVETDARPDGVSVITIEADSAAPKLVEISAARVPLEVSQFGRVRVFRSPDAREEHYAIQIGEISGDPPLARLHSACFTGDVLGSLKCDCGPQLHKALEMMADEGRGLLLYLNQEGRGIGLANKMRAYALQDQGFDTVEANHRLGFEDDERDFRLGSAMLKGLKLDAVRLLTNNPRKVAMLERNGVTVTERVPLIIPPRDENRAYLATKAKKSGHLL